MSRESDFRCRAEEAARLHPAIYNRLLVTQNRVTDQSAKNKRNRCNTMKNEPDWRWKAILQIVLSFPSPRRLVARRSYDSESGCPRLDVGLDPTQNKVQRTVKTSRIGLFFYSKEMAEEDEWNERTFFVFSLHSILSSVWEFHSTRFRTPRTLFTAESSLLFLLFPFHLSISAAVFSSLDHSFSFSPSRLLIVLKQEHDTYTNIRYSSLGHSHFDCFYCCRWRAHVSCREIFHDLIEFLLFQLSQVWKAAWIS